MGLLLGVAALLGQISWIVEFMTSCLTGIVWHTTNVLPVHDLVLYSLSKSWTFSEPVDIRGCFMSVAELVHTVLVRAIQMHSTSRGCVCFVFLHH